MSFIKQDIRKMLGEQIKDKRKYNISDILHDDEPDVEQIKKDTENIISRKPGKA